MNKPFGFRGELKGYIWKDLTEEIDKEGIKVTVSNGIMEVGYDNESDELKARKLAQLYLNAQNFRTGQKIEVNFNHRWYPNMAGGKDHALNLTDGVHMSERVQVKVQTHQISIMGKASIVNQQTYDSASFSNDSGMVDKALKDPVLEQSLHYFNEEVVNNDKPLYGIYKAIEAIEKHLGSDGRKKLANLAGQSFGYVDDVIQTTQTQRHAITLGKRKLSDDECRQRAKVLIEAYASTISI